MYITTYLHPYSEGTHCLVTWYAENSVAIIYIRITNNRNYWSALCSVHGSLPNGNLQYIDEVDCFIFLRKAQDINNVQTNKKLPIDIADINFSDHMAITKIDDIFYIEKNEIRYRSKRRDKSTDLQQCEESRHY